MSKYKYTIAYVLLLEAILGVLLGSWLVLLATNVIVLVISALVWLFEKAKGELS